MKKIGLYQLLNDEPTQTSSAAYWKATKNGENFFLKRFDDPVRPSADMSMDETKRRNDKCDRFEKERKGINEALEKMGGNFVAPTDFFLYNRRYYQATPLRHLSEKSIEQIVQLSDSEKLLILKSAVNCVMLLHKKGIVHCDIKPDNLPITVTKSNKFTCSLIDFDAAHFENDIPNHKELLVTFPYMSPELASYKMQKNYYGNKKFGVKNDVFALAMVLHYYWSGEDDFLFSQPQGGPYLYNAVLEGVPVSVSDKIPQWLETILLKMIDKNPENRPSASEVLEYLKGITLEKTAETVSEEKSPVIKEDPEPEQKGQYIKGEKFPDDAQTFEVLANGNVKFIYKDGSKMVLNINIAIKKLYITENDGG